MSSTFRVMNTDSLIELNRLARKANLNRQLSPTFIEKQLDPDGIHVVFFSMVHNESHIRAGIMCKVRNSDRPVEVFIDMSFDSFNALAHLKREDDGSYAVIKN